ncbi:MAG: DegV family protein [Pseudomonadota bacterium]
MRLPADMQTATLNGTQLRNAVTAGAIHVINQQEYLNSINVFPVPDGDTGTNLAHTLYSVMQRAKRSVDHHAGNVLTLMADAALDGARGNSGAIIAQFFQGLSDSAAGLKELSLSDFSHAVKMGSDYAYSALSEPKEGTLVTVLRDFAEETETLIDADKLQDFRSLLGGGLNRALSSLKNTPNLLDTLKKAGVVDAGAQGFVNLLQGIVEYIASGKMPEAQSQFVSDENELVEAETSDSLHQYCTECLVLGEDIDHRKIRESLSGMGDSLVIAGNRRKVRLHMHVNQPQALFDMARTFGEVSGQKADDMWAQTKSISAAKTQRVAVVVDSAADFPEEDLDRMAGHVVPLRVHFGNVSYLDKVGITTEDFYRMLVSEPEHPKTSQPAPGDFRRLFSHLVSHHYDGVVSIHVTAAHSGTHQSAVAASERVDGERIRVINSKSVSVGIGLLAQMAGNMAINGDNLEEISSKIEEMVANTETYIVLDDLSYAVKGGRVPGPVKIVSDLIRIRPVLTLDENGKIKLGGILFGKSNMASKFANFVAKRVDHNKSYRLAVGHTSSLAAGTALFESLTTRIPSVQDSFFDTTGAALGVHAGPGGLVVALQNVS